MNARSALFGGTLLACGMSAQVASAQQITNISNVFEPQGYIYAYQFGASYATNMDPNGIDLQAQIQENDLFAKFDAQGLRARLRTPRTSYSNYNSGGVYAYDTRFQISADTTLEVEWDFDAAAFFIPSRDIRIREVGGATLLDISTTDGNDPRAGTASVPLEAGVNYELRVKLAYLGNVGGVFVNAYPFGACLADFDGSGGQPNSSDFLAFLNAFSRTDPLADLAPAGGDEAWDSSDFLAYLNLFAQGC